MRKQTARSTEWLGMTNIDPQHFGAFQLAMQVNEPPTAIGSMLFRLLEDIGGGNVILRVLCFVAPVCMSLCREIA